MDSALQVPKPISLGHHYYTVARVGQGAFAQFLRRSAYVMESICDELRLRRRNIEVAAFADPPGQTLYVTLEESSFVIHTYIERELITFDLTVCIPGDPDQNMCDLNRAILRVTATQHIAPVEIVHSHWFDRDVL